MTLVIVPVTLREARAYVYRVHRHHRAPQGGLFAIGAASGSEMVGVVIVGRPVSRMLDDDWTVEVTRLATEGGASLRAAGFRLIGEAGGGSWSRADRPRIDLHPTQLKPRWELSA